MGMGDMEVVDVNGGVTVVGRRPRRKYSIDTLVNKCAGAIRIQEVQPPYRREKRVSPEDRINVTPLPVSVYVCPLSAAALKEKRW